MESPDSRVRTYQNPKNAFWVTQSLTISEYTVSDRVTCVVDGYDHSSSIQGFIALRKKVEPKRLHPGEVLENGATCSFTLHWDVPSKLNG